MQCSAAAAARSSDSCKEAKIELLELLLVASFHCNAQLRRLLEALIRAKIELLELLLVASFHCKAQLRRLLGSSDSRGIASRIGLLLVANFHCNAQLNLSSESETVKIWNLI